MLVGAAWEDITPDRPLPLLGQLYKRIATHTRDPLTANAVVFDNGATQVVIVSVDVCFIAEELIEEIKKRCTSELGLSGNAVVIAATHTHVAPVTTDRFIGRPDADYILFLTSAIVRVIERALVSREECTLFAGAGALAEMGWNRRGMRRDGSCHMYWGSWHDDFVGLEGPRDPEVGVIFARRADDSVKVVIPSFSTHPNCLEQGAFYSADLPGEVRRLLRGVLGSEVNIVYLTGAAANTAPSIMEANPEQHQPWRNESGVIRSGWYLGGEILKVMATAIDAMVEPKLQHEWKELEIPMRPWDAWYDPADHGPAMREFFDGSRTAGPRLLAESNPVSVRIHVVQIGDAAICFNPAELFVELGLAIKKNSPARVTLVAELSDGYCGYVPTPEAIRHGGYSATSAVHTRLIPEAGWMIVETTHELVNTIFGLRDRGN